MDLDDEELEATRKMNKLKHMDNIEEFLEQYNASYPERDSWIAIYPNQIEAIEILIKENKELKEKNKKWEELYDEDQKYITQLNNKIFQLETDNKKLDKENQGLFEAYNFNDTNLLAKTLKEYRKEILNSIPKSKVKEKIEELEKEIEEKQENCLDFTLIHEHEIDTNEIIKVLQELLEGE